MSAAEVSYSSFLLHTADFTISDVLTNTSGGGVLSLSYTLPARDVEAVLRENIIDIIAVPQCLMPLSQDNHLAVKAFLCPKTGVMTKD